MNHSTRDSPFEFSTFVADRTRSFTGRKWVFAEIDRWLADSAGPSLLVITGEPGVGKSALAARLTQIRHIAVTHFCIARNATTIDPVVFAQSTDGPIGYPLTGHTDWVTGVVFGRLPDGAPCSPAAVGTRPSGSRCSRRTAADSAQVRPFTFEGSKSEHRR